MEKSERQLAKEGILRSKVDSIYSRKQLSEEMRWWNEEELVEKLAKDGRIIKIASVARRASAIGGSIWRALAYSPSAHFPVELWPLLPKEKLENK